MIEELAKSSGDTLGLLKVSITKCFSCDIAGAGSCGKTNAELSFWSLSDRIVARKRFIRDENDRLRALSVVVLICRGL